jgi:hypothetical protein
MVLALVPQRAQVVIPDTPAGHTYREWLEDFNSGNRGRIEAYCRKYEPDVKVPASAALSTAQKLATEKLVSK